MTKPKPSYSPVYCAIYPALAEIARKHGYALAVHGSLQRDFDLICVPWIEKPSEPRAVVDEMTREFALMEVGEPETRLHNREVFTLVVGHGECFLDLSFMPIIPF